MKPSIALLALCLTSCAAAGVDPASLAFSEDFEEQTEGAAPEAPWAVAGALTVTADRAANGRRSVHLQPGADWDGRSILSLYDVPSELQRAHFGRAQFFVPEVSVDGVHWNMIMVSGQARMEGVWEGESFESMLAYGGMHEKSWLAGFDTPGGYSGEGPSSDCWQDSRVAFPEGRWACIEPLAKLPSCTPFLIRRG